MKPPVPSSREVSPPVIGALPPAPNSAADYDGFSAVDDDDAPSQVTPPVGSRAAGQSSPDQEDEALRRKLTICKNCK
jgi:hypothetical protein